MSIVNITGPTLFEHQKEVVRKLDSMQPGGTLVVKSARQRGKTFLMDNILLRQSINYNNTTSIICEPSWAQCKRVFRSIVKACKGIPIIESANAGDMVIYFKNGSEIQFLSGSQSDDNVRGSTVSKNGVLIFDEAAFLRDSFVQKCVPFRNANRAKIIAVSTPMFKEHYFWNEYKAAVEGLVGNELVDFNDYDTSALYPPEMMEHDKLTMPHLIYLTEVLGEFVDLYSTLFGDLNAVVAQPDNNEIDSLGIDWGAGVGNDFTAVVGFNQLHQMTFCDGWNDVKPTEQIKLICNIIQRYKPKKITVETNSIGEVYFDMLKKEVQKLKLNTPVKGFTTTNESKRKIVEGLATAIQNKRLTILDHPVLKLHLSAYEIESTRTGKITYNGQNGTHDDFCIATSIAYDQLNKSTRYFVA